MACSGKGKKSGGMMGEGKGKAKGGGKTKGGKGK
jgi:hypothetical protein